MSKLVLVSPESSFAIDSSMFLVNGSWESGYEYDEEIFFMLNIEYVHEYSSSPINVCTLGGEDFYYSEKGLIHRVTYVHYLNRYGRISKTRLNGWGWSIEYASKQKFFEDKIILKLERSNLYHNTEDIIF